ncbi:hypothetical protein P154DRAFT_9837 [Amniculicola lignicola CBS 123094]|uniref:Uncharacterized protein n=1 Tax=Amniculicola lignicola CBS 123094 TaxID=1392246 RepID=A0A6A5X4C9_9PLEO|nr:hypothetical protein P154DRAFT_9837 [Amniculicola lignicola CBS 123094]
MTTMAHPSRHSFSGDAVIQKDMLLSSQHEAFRRRISLQIPASPPLNMTSPELESLSASSPPRHRSNYSSIWSMEPDSSSVSARPIPTTPGMGHRNKATESPIHEDQILSCEVNLLNKATLTELLNTKSVRSDEKYRAWVQDRLMGAEQQIRKQRRRRSSIDRDVAAGIAASL